MRRTITLAIFSILLLILGLLIGNTLGLFIAFMGGHFGARAAIEYSSYKNQ